MSPDIWVALISVVGGGGGLFALVRAVMDFRNGKASRESDAEERLITRLEKRLDSQDQKIIELESQLQAERRRSSDLTLALVQAGIPLPVRELHKE